MALLTTEQANRATTNLDLMTAREIVTAINTEDHIAMYLVAHDDDTFLGTDVGNLLQVFLLPTDACGIVGVAEYHHLAALDVAAQAVEVHREGGLGATQ